MTQKKTTLSTGVRDRRHRILFFCTILCLLAASAWAQQTNGPAADIPAQAMRAVLLAHGAGWQSGQVNSVAQGTLTIHALTGSKGVYQVTVMQKGTDKIQRIIKPARGGEVRQGSDGVRNWFSQAGPFKVQGVPEDVRTFVEGQTLRSVQAVLSAGQISLQDAGNSSKGKAIAATDSSGRKTTFYIDPETSLITRAEFIVGETKSPFGKSIPITEAYVFSDYRRVQGLQTPFRIERYRNAVKMEEMQFTTVTHAAVSEDTFKP